MNISIGTKKNFTTAFNQMKAKYGEEFEILNGLSDSQLNYNSFIENFVDEDTVADASIDGNANVGHKDIVTLLHEMPKPHQKLLGFNKIFYEINKQYDYKTAKQWLEEEWRGGSYMHDAASVSFFSYCFAYDLEELVNKGLFFIENFNAQAPEHLPTYVDFVAEFVSWNCNRTSGAVGLPSFLVYAYYFWMKDVQSGHATKSPEYHARQEMQRMVYKMNQPFLRGGIQSAFTNWSIFDSDYLVALFGGKTFPNGELIIDHIDGILDFQKMAMETVSKIRRDNMMTFPVLTFSLLRDKDGKWGDEEFAKWCCRHNMEWGDSNFYVSDSVDSLSNCCRLKSNVEDLGYFNSIGGTALKVGSIKVNTINLAQIAYEAKDKQEFFALLQEKVEICLKALHCVRSVIKRNVQKGLLPNFKLGIVEFETCYNTIGVIGFYEALEKFGYIESDASGVTINDYGVTFGKKLFKAIHAVKDSFALDKDYMINVEQIPGERAATILMEKDKILYPNEKYELPLYGNQYIPLGVKCTLQEKIRTAAIFDEACNGGSIAHINIDAPFSNFDQAWEVLNYIADKGVTYFAFNLKISACKNNHGFYGETCPVCGEPKQTTYSRIVGFLVPEKTFSQKRKEEFTLRDWFDLNQPGIM